MTKLHDFLRRNEATLREDAGERPAGAAQPASSRLDGRARLTNAAAIAVERITADPQTRKTFDEVALRRLADNLKEHGQLQPIRVRWDEARALYVIIAGERRWRAAKLAGMASVECVVAEGLDVATVRSQQVIENALREDLAPVEQAAAYKDVMDAHGWNGKQLAEHLQLDPSTVCRSLALLKLDAEMQRAVDAGDVAPTIAIRKVQSSRGKRSAARQSREHTLKTSLATVTVKGRRQLTDDDVRRALGEALAAA